MSNKAQNVIRLTFEVMVMVRYLVGNEKNKVWLLIKSPVSQLLGCHVQLQHAFAKSEK